MDAELAVLLAELQLLQPLSSIVIVSLRSETWGPMASEFEVARSLKVAAEEIGALRQRLAEDLRHGRIHLLPADPKLAARGGRAPITVSLLELRAPGEAVLWIEDRTLHLRGQLDGKPIVQAFDLLGDLVQSSKMAPEQARACMRRLREAEFRFQPTPADEIVRLLAAAPVTKAGVVETRELAAVRRAFARDLQREALIRVGPAADTPTAEAGFLVSAYRRLDAVLREIWSTRASTSKRRAWSNWAVRSLICERLDRLGHDAETRRNLAELSLASWMDLGFVAGRTVADKKAAYSWVWSGLLAPAFEADAELARAAPRVFAHYWLEALPDEDGQPVPDTPERREIRTGLCLSCLANMPDEMRNLLMRSAELREFIRERFKPRIDLGGLRFEADPVFAAMIQVSRDGQARTVKTVGQDLKISWREDRIAIGAKGRKGDIIVAGELLDVVVGDPAKIRGAVDKALGVLDIDAAELEIIVDRVSAISNPHDRVMGINDARSETMLGRLQAIEDAVLENKVSVSDLTPPPPAAFVRWLRSDETGEIELQGLIAALGEDEALLRLAGAPLNAWAQAFSLCSAAARDRFIAVSDDERSPIGALAALTAEAALLEDDALRSRVERLVARFEKEGDALLGLVDRFLRLADHDQGWREADPVLRIQAMWIWTDLVWRLIVRHNRPPEGFEAFWQKISIPRPRDWIVDGACREAMAPSWIHSPRVLAVGLAFALGERLNTIVDEGLMRRIAQLTLSAANRGTVKPLGPLSRSRDAARTWLALTPPMFWAVDTAQLEEIADKFVTSFPGEPDSAFHLVLGGPDILSPQSAQTFLQRLALVKIPDGDTWPSHLRLIMVAAQSLERQGLLNEALRNDILSLFEALSVHLRQRSDWSKLREAYFHHAFSVISGWTPDAIAGAIERMAEGAPDGEREAFRRLTELYLVALPLELRAPIWRANLALRVRA